jgi:hypothetical protein
LPLTLKSWVFLAYHLISEIQQLSTESHTCSTFFGILFDHCWTTRKTLYFFTWINSALHFTLWGQYIRFTRQAFLSSFPDDPNESKKLSTHATWLRMEQSVFFIVVLHGQLLIASSFISTNLFSLGKNCIYLYSVHNFKCQQFQSI